MYSFYREQYHGAAIEQDEFPELLERARDQMEAYCRSYRVAGDDRAKKMALCALAETIGYFDAAQNGQGGLRYAAVGTVSISGKGIYSEVDITPAAQARELYRAAEKYLEIYRGCGSCKM